MRIWKRLLGTALCLCAAVCVMSVSASAAGEHTGHPICGANHKNIGDHTGTCEAVTWTAWDGTSKITYDSNNTAYVYLSDNATPSSTLTVTDGKTLNLCLNGHSITKTSASNTFHGVITVEPGASFTLCDCNGSGMGNGKITHADGVTGRGVLVGSSRVKTTFFLMYGGTISGNRINGQDGAGVRVQNASFKMYGGTITDNHVEKMPSGGDGGGGVNARGKFIMYGGEISRNTSNGDCGGVAVVGDSFEMHGGTISGNTATGVVGGVGLWNDSFTLSGGTISDNTAKGDGGGVYFSGNTLTISDTVEISGNSAANGGGVYLKSRNLTMTGGSIINNNATGSGGGVYFNGSSFNVSGNVSITGNKRGATSTGSGLIDGTDNNVYLPNGKTITVGGALTGSNKIGVTTENTPDDSMYVQIASGNKDYATPDKFRYENNDTTVSAVVSGRTTKLVACRHNWSSEWKTDRYQHWKECSICKGKKDESAHTYDQNKTEEIYKASDATCTSPALYYMSCVCGAEGADTFESGEKNPNGHDWGEPSYVWNGTSCTAERVCSRDGSHKETETATAAVTVTQNKDCVSDELSTYTASFQNTAFAEQTKENVVTASKLGHDFEKGTWQSDGDHHWKKCSRCDVTDEANKAPHAGGAATCIAKAVCASCGTAYGNFDPNGHDWGEWRVTKPATTSAAGEETRTCKRDGTHTETRDIPKLTPAPSGGGSGSAPAITVPVSGSGDTVHVSASVSGSTAEVKEIKRAELDKIGTDSAVVIDLSGLNKGVTGVTLSTDTIDSICKTEADGVTIKLPNAELRVDRQTLAAVTEQAAGSKLRLVVEPDSTARNTMTAAQKSTLAGMKNAAALEAYFVSNDTRIHDFKGGSVELSIPYRAEGAIRAWFLKEDGTREPVSARYDKENAQLILRHFSHYVIEELDSSAAYTVCAKDDSCPLGAFSDLTAAAWYHDGVHYCLENDLMRGVSDGKFLPDGSTTRAQLVTILWRLEGNPAPVSTADFSDVADGVWYAEAVRWAAGCGVVKGYDNGCFGPNDAVTREQMAAILYRYAQHKGYDVSAGNDTNILSFDDAFAVSEYAIPAMQWACGSGMVHGIAQKGGMLLAPRDTTTRAQTATLLMRFQSAFAKEP